MSFSLPSLSYKYDELEPYFDKKTMEIHHTKHHQTYVNNTNDIMKHFPEFNNLSICELIQKINLLPEDKRTALRNNAGGHANHSLFWKILKKGIVLHGALKESIEYNFKSVQNFKEEFEQVAMSHFGSGWVWLLKKDRKLLIKSTNNQDNPIMEQEISKTFGYPILCLDIWEHAYYLKYQNRKLDYVKSFWNVVNWDEVYNRFQLN